MAKYIKITRKYSGIGAREIMKMVNELVKKRGLSITIDRSNQVTESILKKNLPESEINGAIIRIINTITFNPTSGEIKDEFEICTARWSKKLEKEFQKEKNKK